MARPKVTIPEQTLIAAVAEPKTIAELCVHLELSRPVVQRHVKAMLDAGRVRQVGYKWAANDSGTPEAA